MWWLGASIVFMTRVAPVPSHSPVQDSAAAVKLVQSMYTSESKKDPNLRIQFDSTVSESGHVVYVVRVFDEMLDHTASLDWVLVRDDGSVKSEFFQSNFGPPSTYEQVLVP